MSLIGGGFRRITGFVEVKQEGAEIIISGFSAQALSQDMRKIWATTKIASNMFTKITWGDVRIPTFFALELDYVLNQLLLNKGLTSTKRVIRNIIDGLRENTWLAGIEEKPQSWFNWKALDRAFIYDSLLPHQIDFLKKYESTVHRYNIKGLLLAAAPGAGKAQPLYSKIKTPHGWKLMGDMKVGDVVSTPDGGAANVVGVYPQGVKDIYEITFSDGRKVRACGDHLWPYFNPYMKDKTKGYEITDTKTLKGLVDAIKTTKCPRYYRIPLTAPVSTPGHRLPLKPYILGLLLGDGGLRHQIVFTSPDEQLVNALADALPEDCVIRKSNYNDFDYFINGTIHGNNPFLNKMREMGLHGKYSHEKYIPEIYMNAHLNDRWELLQGLMDTDGTVDLQSSTSYSTTSEKLAKQVQELVWSLGGIAAISTKKSTYTYDGEKRQGRLAYNVNIRIRKPSNLFKLQRKKDRCNDNGQYVVEDRLKLGIRSIDYIGDEEAQCIMVDHPDHLYITDNYVVTHNTVNGIALSLLVDAEVVIIVCPKNAAVRVWKKTLEEEMRVPQYPYVAELDGAIQPGRKYHVFHYEALDRAVQLAKTVSEKNVCIILDESHNLNEIKSKRTELFLDVCRFSNSKNIVWASGTPVKAMGFETIPLLRSLDPLFNEQAELAFRKMYGRDAKRTLDILAHRLGLITHVVPKTNVMPDKPVLEQIRVKIPNSERYTLGRITELMDAFIKERSEYYLKNKPHFKKIYDAQIDIHRLKVKTPEELDAFKKYQQTIEYLIRNGFDARRDGDLAVFTNRYEKEQIIPFITDSETRKAFQNAKSVVKYVELKIRGECLGRILTKERIQCHLDMLPFVPFDNIITGSKKKTIIFTSYIRVVENTLEILTSKGYHPLVVYGATNNELASTVAKFDKDEKLNPLIATFQSLSTAVPLTMANSIIFLNNPWRSYEKEQAIARAHRIGQDQTVYCFDIILDTGDKPNISSRSLDIMEWSKDQVDKIMGLTNVGNVSVECNGFITPNVVVDFNEVLDDVLISQQYRGPNVTDLVEDVDALPASNTDAIYHLYKS